MTSMVQAAVAGSIDEAEEMKALLAEAGIEAQIETAVVHDPAGTEDVPQRVLVPESDLETALEAIEALTEPDEPVPD
jgi:type III secretory pathway lipoprotein EscJ